jgi:hypothetical protein
VIARLTRARAIELLRPALGFAFALMLPMLPLESRWTTLFFVLALLAFMVARVLVLVEPEARRFLATHPLPMWMHLGEATCVMLALVFGLLMLAGQGLTIGIGAGVLIAVCYLLLHGVGLTLAERAVTGDDKPARPSMRSFIAGTTFVAEESLLLATMVMTEGERAAMSRAPWDLSSTLTLPLVAVVVLIACYVPIQRLSRAAGDPEALPIDALAIQITVLFVYALTGTQPL